MTSRRSFIAALAALALPWKGKARRMRIVSGRYSQSLTYGSNLFILRPGVRCEWPKK